ncbi:Netrin receptor UNC5C [Schistosoma japonicum]|nr:Netrin receptor UNC5C [Schistosoma japonicum]
MSPLFYILNIYFFQKFSFTTCNIITYKLNYEKLNFSSLEHLMITGDSLMGIYNDIFQMKSSSGNLDIKTYELKPEEELLYTDIPHYIIQPPSILYTSKWQPAIVYCVAEPVILLYIVCVTNPTNSNVKYERRIQQGIELSTDQIIKQKITDYEKLFSENSNIDLNKQNRKTIIRLIDENTVEEWFGDYWCQCEAWNNILKLGEPRVKISNQTHVRIAYLNKRFIKHPESTRIPLGWTVEFTCEPPEGRPMPKVYWMRNGRKLEVDHTEDLMSNVSKQMNDLPDYQIINNNLNVNYSRLISRLIIRNTHLKDEGTYACVVENQAGRRISSNAQLSIHIDGHWSAWSSWTNCPQDCIILQQTYTTLSQLSLNQSKMLISNNKLNCSIECRQLFGQRTRLCNAPEPHGGGRKCHGDNVEHLSCYDICLDSLTSSQSIPQHEFNPFINRLPITTSEIGLLLSLILAILFFLISATCVLYVFANRWCPIFMKLLPMNSLVSMKLFHSLSMNWLQYKPDKTKVNYVINSSLSHDMNSLQQFIEYKSEIINSSQQFNSCQQTLHYDCISLLPMNRNENRSVVYTDSTIHPDMKYTTTFNRINNSYERASYQCSNNNQFHMNLLHDQSNSQMELCNHMNETNDTLNLPIHLTYSHSTQFINNLQSMPNDNHQFTTNHYKFIDSFHQLNRLIHYRNDVLHHSMKNNQCQLYIPTTSLIINKKLPILEDYVNPYYSVDISLNPTDSDQILSTLNEQKTSSIIQSIVPISS